MKKKMKQLFSAVYLLIFCVTFLNFTPKKNTPPSFKCLIQLTNYTGEGAYIAVSLVDKNGRYIKTLQIFGKEKKWYDDIQQWYKNMGKTKTDGITGASITAGSRKVFSFSIDEKYYNSGYKLKFETAVEDKDYAEKDLVLDFSEDNIGKNINGSTYIRYVKLFSTQ